MPTVTVFEAQARLPELIEGLRPGETLIITRDEKPVAKLTTPDEGVRRERKLGTLEGTVLSIADDFDAPLEDFREYME